MATLPSFPVGRWFFRPQFSTWPLPLGVVGDPPNPALEQASNTVIALVDETLQTGVMTPAALVFFNIIFHQVNDSSCQNEL